jgi:phosphatidylserine/phosphatidylglycerophosphate/cardiolipin synthase-like enzyme
MSNAIQDPLATELPRKIQNRPVVVRPNALTTVRLMHDPKDIDKGRWFDDGPDARPVREGNEVTYLVRGRETLEAMAQAIREAGEPLDEPDLNHRPLIYLLGWSCSLDVPMVEGDATTTLERLLRAASARGVEIRSMLWANLKGPSDILTAMTGPQVQFINTLPTGRAILDAKTTVLTTIMLPSGGDLPPMPWPIRRGSHHQKVLITNGKRGLTAFCGGIDIFVDRINPGLHDVHCKIRGPAAKDLLDLFAQRWDDYLNDPNPALADFDAIPPRTPPTTLDPLGRPDHSRDFLSAARIPTPPASFGSQSVQVGRTTPKGLYTRFRPQGEQSLRRMILKGIGAAQSFIYMEDQYLLNLDCADALAKAAAKPSVRFLFIVIPDDNAIDGESLNLPSYHRAEFLRRVRGGAGAEKVHVFAAERYVHSKTYIFDDKYVITGSANCNRRGWEHDSEVVAGIFDAGTEDEPALTFARRLRMKLWADHLNLAGGGESPLRPSNSDGEFADVADALGAAAHWVKRPAKARIRPYFPTDHKGKTAQQTLIETLQQELHSSLPPPPNATLRNWEQAFENMLDGFLAQHAPNADRVWNEVIDPPSPL